MMMPAKNFSKTQVAFLLLGAMCVLMATTADARGGRGGGGFSRGGVASGGGFSSSPAAIQRGIGGAGTADGVGQARTARDTGGAGQARTAGSAGGVQSTDGAGQAGAVGDAGTAGGVRNPGVAQQVSPQDMAKYREQFQQQNKDQSVDWDARRPVDPEYGVPAPGTGVVERPATGLVVGRPAAVVGAVAGAAAIARADDYVDFVNTVDDPAYLTEDDCSIKAITAVNDVTYYRCSDAWYTRGYQSGNVVYIPSNPPAGY
jgi:hypothetical protein